MQSPQTNIGSRMALLKTMAYSDFQCGPVKRCHLSNKSVCQISALLELPRSNVSAVIVRWKLLGATTAQQRSGRPHKLTERNRRVLKRGLSKKRLSSFATLTTEFQTVRQELYEIAFHGRAAAQKPKITIQNVNCWLEWCKACRHWTLEQWKRVETVQQKNLGKSHI